MISTAAPITFKKLTDTLFGYLSRYNKIFKIKNEIPLSTMWAANYMDQAGEANQGAKRSFVLGSSTVNLWPHLGKLGSVFT